jgi:hypothetical protein
MKCTPATLTTDLIPGGVPGWPGNPRGGRVTLRVTSCTSGASRKRDMSRTGDLRAVIAPVQGLGRGLTVRIPT